MDPQWCAMGLQWTCNGHAMSLQWVRNKSAVSLQRVCNMPGRLRCREECMTVLYNRKMDSRLSMCNCTMRSRGVAGHGACRATPTTRRSLSGGWTTTRFAYDRPCPQPCLAGVLRLIRPDWPRIWHFAELPEVISAADVLDRNENHAVHEWIRLETPVAVEFQVDGVRAFDMDRDETAGRRFLASLDVPIHERCTVIWVGEHEGLRMPVDLCFRFFYDVWYPGADEIWILPESRRWVIECDHEGWLRFVALAGEGSEA